MGHSRGYDEALAQVDRDREYDPADAVALLKSLGRAKFDESVELHVRTSLNVRHAEEQLRGTIALPNGLGKDVTVAVFAQGDKAREAEEAGADFAGGDDLATKITSENWLDFDKAIATPDMMGVVGKLGKVLGPRGLMPNPKVGTVTMDVGKAVRELKAGKVEYRVEKAGIVHVPIGKRSFSAEKLAENIRAFVDSVSKAKPQGSKGTYMERMAISSTMGPGVKVDISSVNNA